MFMIYTGFKEELLKSTLIIIGRQLLSSGSIFALLALFGGSGLSDMASSQ
jgi:hypothetical protein